MRYWGIAAATLAAITIGLTGCTGGSAGDSGDEEPTGDDAGGIACCPYQEPESGEQCSGDCENCGYTSPEACSSTPFYSCTDGTWEQVGRDDPGPGCGDAGLDGGDTVGDVAPDGGGRKTLSLDMSNSPTPLPQLGSDYQWEGWLVDAAGTPTSTGVFEAEPGKDEYTWEIPDSATDEAEKFVLSIEPKPDDDPSPSNTKLLAGTLDSGEAELSTGPTLGDFSSASGTYILSAPTASDSEAKNTHGIWFLRPASGAGETPQPGFQGLPDLQGKGWTYEGWIIDTSGGEPVAYTTGKFADEAESWTAPDRDGAGPSAGPNSGEAPDVPGSDYVGGSPGGNDFDLTSGGNWRTALTVEPSVGGADNAPDRPFPVKIFGVQIQSDTEPGTEQSMDETTGNLPTGKVSIDS